MSNMILPAWPGKASSRNKKIFDFDFAFDGQVHVLTLPLGYKSMESFRRCVFARADKLMKKIETCTHEDHPGALIVRCVGELGEDE